MTKKTKHKIVSLFIGFCLLTTAGASLHLRNAYVTLQQETQQHLGHSSDLIAEWIRSALITSDYLLRDISGHITPSHLNLAPGTAANTSDLSLLMQEKMASLPHVNATGVFNRDCISIHGSALLGFDASLRAYCYTLKSDMNRDAMVSPAFWTNTGILNVTQARALRDEQGHFEGLVSLSLDMDYFAQWLQRLSAGQNQMVSIIDTHQRLLAREPPATEFIGEVLPATAMEAFIQTTQRQTSYSLQSPIDGVGRLIVARKVDDYPFITIVAVANRDIRQAWYRELYVALVALLMLWTMAGITLKKHHSLLANQEKLAEAAQTDELTGVANRRYFIQQATREISRARRTNSDISVLILDLDLFKEINDRYGHQLGDQALKHFAQACIRGLREEDIFARWGGDEFVVLVAEGPQGAQATALRLKENITETRIISEHGDILPLKTSIGIATARGKALSTIENLIDKADQALMQSKQQGRNTITHAGNGKLSD